MLTDVTAAPVSWIDVLALEAARHRCVAGAVDQPRGRVAFEHIRNRGTRGRGFAGLGGRHAGLCCTRARGGSQGDGAAPDRAGGARVGDRARMRIGDG